MARLMVMIAAFLLCVTVYGVTLFGSVSPVHAQARSFAKDARHDAIAARVRAAPDDAQERAVLVDFYASTNGENWYHADNWLSDTVHHCHGWYGVRCDADGRIHMLDLIGNNLDGPIPESFTTLEHLQYLDLYFNNLTALPEAFGDLTKLWRLNLGSNGLTSLPQSFGNLAELQELCLYDNLLTELPDSFANLTKLQHLYLYGNQLTALPDAFGNLTGLQTLHLYDNQLTTLPQSITELTNLQYLYLQHNRLTELPESFGALSALTYLNILDNRLAALPDSMASLTNVRHLYMHDNLITCLSAELSDWYSTIWEVSPYHMDVCPAGTLEADGQDRL